MAKHKWNDVSPTSKEKRTQTLWTILIVITLFGMIMSIALVEKPQITTRETLEERTQTLLSGNVTSCLFISQVAFLLPTQQEQELEEQVESCFLSSYTVTKAMDASELTEKSETIVSGLGHIAHLSSDAAIIHTAYQLQKRQNQLISHFKSDVNAYGTNANRVVEELSILPGNVYPGVSPLVYSLAPVLPPYTETVPFPSLTPTPFSFD